MVVPQPVSALYPTPLTPLPSGETVRLNARFWAVEPPQLPAVTAELVRGTGPPTPSWLPAASVESPVTSGAPTGAPTSLDVVAGARPL